MTSSLSPSPMVLIAGPCVIEDEAMVLEIAQELSYQAKLLGVSPIFKASFDKANRSSGDSFRGVGMVKGLKILEKVKAQVGLPVLTDLHSVDQIDAVSSVVDVLQIPAFLCRQTDLVEQAALSAFKKKKKLNVKKGQFLAPWDAQNILDKIRGVSEGSLSSWVFLTERGVCFGYQNLVVDMAGIAYLKKLEVPIIYDATHSVQVPGGGPGEKKTGGKKENIEPLARAAIAAGADGIFLECHPNPKNAKSDASTCLPLRNLHRFLKPLVTLYELTATFDHLKAHELE